MPDRSARGTGRSDPIRQRKGRESNPQGCSLARVRVGCRRPSACPSVFHRRELQGRDSNPHATGRLINSEVRLPFRHPGIDDAELRSGRPDSNRRSPAPEAGGMTRLSHAPNRDGECPAGVEPARSPWQGERLPLHHGHTRPSPDCQRDESTGWASNPRSRLTRAESCPLDHQCGTCQRMGPEGLEPSPAWLRARCAAANTLVPEHATSQPGRSRTSVVRLSAECSPLELRAVLSVHAIPLPRDRAGGTRTPTPRLKRPMCSRYTTTPARSSLIRPTS